MAKTVSNLLNQARAWMGYNESNGSHKQIIDVYNSHKPLARGYAMKYTDEWCATFVSACAIKCGMTDIIPTECGCEPMIKLFMSKGCWLEDESITPKAGDIIFYDWQDNGIGDNKGWSDHVGIVESVSNGKITVIEGNMSCAVGRRVINVNGRYIRGYARPKYEAEPQVAPNPTPTLKYKVGDKVKVSSYYASSTAPNSQAVIRTATGTITRVLTNGAKNPYLLNDGALGWCNDGDIRELLTDAKVLKVGCTVKLKSTAQYYTTGQLIPSWVKTKAYTVYQMNGDKVLLKEIMSWVYAKDVNVQ